MNNVCIICREEMVSQCKKLPCNHIFHTHCLHSWFQRQQSCPTCRMDVLSQTVIARLQGRRQQQPDQQQQQRNIANGGPQQNPQAGQGSTLDDQWDFLCRYKLNLQLTCNLNDVNSLYTCRSPSAASPSRDAPSPHDAPHVAGNDGTTSTTLTTTTTTTATTTNKWTW